MNLKKFIPVLLAVLLVSAVFVIPAFAQEPTPPPESAEVVMTEPIEPPVFDWAKISNALTDLLTAFLIPAAAFAARWLFAKGSVEYTKLTEAQREGFRLFLRTAIYAAEQMDLKGKVGNKLDYVVSLAEVWLAQNRLVIGLDEIKTEVEAIVAREFNMGKILAPRASAPRING
jgi:hypothetical protein